MKEGIYICYLKDDAANQLNLKTRFVYAYYRPAEEFGGEFEGDAGIAFGTEDCVHYSKMGIDE